MFFTMREELVKIDKGAVPLMKKLWGTQLAQYNQISKDIEAVDTADEITRARERKARSLFPRAK